MVCKLDNHRNIVEVEAAVKDGTMTINEAALELDCTYQEAWRHFKECLNVPIEQIEFEGYLNILRQLVVKMNGRVNDLELTPTNPASVKMVTALVKEIRGLISKLAELEGRMSRSPMLQLTQVNVKFNRLTSFMFNELCDECKLKLSSQLNQMELPKLEDYR